MAQYTEFEKEERTVIQPPLYLQKNKHELLKLKLMLQELKC
jgi:hypothetical protein